MVPGPTAKDIHHALRIDESRCNGCVECTKACPAKAIRVRGGVARVLPERCIDCGECFRVCPRRAIIPVTTTYMDLTRFKYKVVLPSPALYSQFGPNTMPEDILQALLLLGFDYAYDKAYMCELVFSDVKKFIEENYSGDPFISPVCPAVTRLIQLMFPDLTDLILPFRAPREIAAKAIKSDVHKRLGIEESEIGVIHITPCLAKLAAMANPPTEERSFLDGAVGISEVYGSLLGALKDSKAEKRDQPLHRSSGTGINFGRSGGEVAALGIEASLAVSGVKETFNILKAVERGKLRDIKYLECQICPGGCIGGPLTVQNRYIASNTISSLVKLFGRKLKVEEMTDLEEYDRNYFRLASKIRPQAIPALDTDTSIAIGKMRLREQISRALPGKNCGACGAPDCKTLADDIVRGLASIEDCIFVKSGLAGGRIAELKGIRKR